MENAPPVVHSTKAVMAKDQPANLTKEVEMANAPPVVHSTKVEMEKGPPANLMKEVAIAKGQNVDRMKEAQIEKAITTVNQPKKIIRAASQIPQVLMAA